MEHPVRVLELYSGIGGMHFALTEAGIACEVIAAIDINTVANEVYQHNFPQTKLMARSIESVSIKELDKMSPDMILMSPPCQPFTRVGKQKDSDDIRTKSFLHLLEILPRLKKVPNYILVENVKGFDTSDTRHRMLEALAVCKYQVQEFLLTPLQFGVPNSRLRYYLLAKRAPLCFNFDTSDTIQENVPDCALPFMLHRTDCCNDHPKQQQQSLSNTEHESEKQKGTVAPESDTKCPGHEAERTNVNVNQNMATCMSQLSNCLTPVQGSDEKVTEQVVTESQCPNGTGSAEPLYLKYQHLCRTVSHYLENKTEDYFEQYAFPEKFYKTFWVMDIVKEDARNSCCFTKRYAHHMEGSGSVLQMANDVDSERRRQMDKHRLSKPQGQSPVDPTVTAFIQSLKLRFFTPREISNLMCFPSEFSFPDGISQIQRYRVLGNSLNVHVVAVLIQLLTMEESPKETSHLQ